MSDDHPGRTFDGIIEKIYGISPSRNRYDADFLFPLVLHSDIYTIPAWFSPGFLPPTADKQVFTTAISEDTNTHTGKKPNRWKSNRHRKIFGNNGKIISPNIGSPSERNK
jgi:hypothetical protein